MWPIRFRYLNSGASELRSELCRFFSIKTDDELTEFLRDPIANSPLKIVRNGIPLVSSL